MCVCAGGGGVVGVVGVCVCVGGGGMEGEGGGEGGEGNSVILDFSERHVR